MKKYILTILLSFVVAKSFANKVSIYFINSTGLRLATQCDNNPGIYPTGWCRGVSIGDFYRIPAGAGDLRQFTGNVVVYPINDEINLFTNFSSSRSQKIFSFLLPILGENTCQYPIIKRHMDRLIPDYHFEIMTIDECNYQITISAV